MPQVLLKKPEEEEQDPNAPLDPNAPIGKRILSPDAMNAPIGKPIMAGGAPPDAGVNVPPPEPKMNPGLLMQSPDAVNPDVATAQTRLSGLLQKGEPQYTGGKKILDTLAGMFPIGRDIEANAGIGTVGYDTRKKKAESDLASAMGTEKENQSIRSNEALEEERRMKDELVPNPAGPDLPMIPRGQLTSPTTAIINQTGAANRTAATNQNRIDVAETNINAKAALQSNAHLTLDQLAAQAVKEGDQATLATIEEYKQKIAKSGATEPGSYIPFNDAQGNVTGWVNPKANKFVGVGAIPGAAASMGPQNPGTPPVMPPKPTAGEQNDLKGAQEDLNYADLYEQSGVFTGAGDEMLMEKYFDLAKPRSGFRMSQPQIEMLLKAKSWMVSAEGAAYHASTGQWFPPQQRNEIIATMRMGAQAKGVGNKPTPNTPAAPAAGELTPAQRFMQNRKKPNG